jgi:hypothetical protein
MSPIYSGTFNTETGEKTKVELTEEQEIQHCYQSLIDDVRREEFDKSLISLIKNYMGEIDEWTNIKIEVSFSNTRQLMLNTGNPDNIQWQKFEMPEIEGQ